MVGKLDKEIIEKFKEFQENTGKHSELYIEDVEFEKISLANEEYFTFIKGKNKYIQRYIKVNKGDYPILGSSLKNSCISAYIKPIDKNDIVNQKSVTFNKDNAKGSVPFFRDYPYLMDRHHIAIIPNTELVDARYLEKSLIHFFEQKKFGWGDNVADVDAVQKHYVPIPKDLNKFYSSYQIQEAIVEFFEYSFERIDRIRENIDKRYAIFERLKKALIPSTFIKDYVKVAFGRYVKEKGIDFNILDVEFEQIQLSEIADTIRAGGTPKRKVKKYWTTFNDTKGYPWLDIDRKEFETYRIKIYREKITAEGMKNSSAWIVPKNSIMITIGGSLGYVALNEIELSTNQNILNVILQKEYNSKYVMYNLENFYRFNIRNKKSTYGNLSKTSESKRIIFIPKDLENYTSLEIQKIIADFIEYTENRLQKEFDKMNVGYNNLKRLHKTYLARTFSLIDWGE